MILYAQYSSISVLTCVSSLPAPFCSRWFHLQMVFFVTITIANIIFYWGMVLHAQFLPMNFFFVSVSLLLSPYRYRWFQVVPACSRWFQLVPPFSMYENSNNRETKRSQRNDNLLNLLFCYYFSAIFTHDLILLSTHYQVLSKYNRKLCTIL